MQFTAVAVLALAAAVSATYSNETIVYTTEIHTALTTVCPASTELTYNGVTYTATESTTLTITNCPCTVVKPVTTSSYVYCNTCAVSSTAAVTSVTPVYPTSNGTAVVTSASSTKTAVGTTSAYATANSTAALTANGADKVAMSGASLAGLLGLAAYLL